MSFGFDRLTDRFPLLERLDLRDVGHYWYEEHPKGFHGGRNCGYMTGCGYWRERWWAPSRLWRERWCYLGIHHWCLVGPFGSGDHWYVGTGIFAQWDYEWRRFCSRCSAWRGSRKRRRPPSVPYTACPDCGITAKFLVEMSHGSTCSRPIPDALIVERG